MYLLAFMVQLLILSKYFLCILVDRHHQKFVFIDINTNKSLLSCLRDTQAFWLCATV